MKNAVGSISLAALLLAGCSAHSNAAAPLMPAPSQQVTNVGFSDDGIDATTVEHVSARLTNEAPFNSSVYGKVLGYFKGKTSTTSEVVTLPMATEVRFYNVDSSLPHTVSFLGDATKTSAPWPGTFNGSTTKSPAGTDIGTTGFSTGTLVPGSHSALYNTGAPGFYMVGCGFHYNMFGMRTVIIVK